MYFSGHAALTLRSRLQCVVLRKSTDESNDKKKPTTILVLNEVVVDRGPSPYLSNIDLFLDGKHITSVQGDGEYQINRPPIDSRYSFVMPIDT